MHFLAVLEGWTSTRGTVIVVQIMPCICFTPRLFACQIDEKKVVQEKSPIILAISQAIHADNVLPPSEHPFHVDILRPSICKATSFPSYSTSCSRSSIVCHLCPKHDRWYLDRVSRRLIYPDRTYVAAALLRFAVHKSNMLGV